METKEQIVILGAGPAGLAAAYRLAKAGKCPLVLEYSSHAGGLMRGIRRGGFSVDLGRKEIYERIDEVTALWEEVLKEDFIPYSHRVGLLFGGRIIEYSKSFRGPLRGIPLKSLGCSLIDFWIARLRAIGAGSPANYEERWHRTWGPKLTRMLAQGFSEKFYGVLWKDRPINFDLRKSDEITISSGFFDGFRSILRKAMGKSEAEKAWRHPRFGTQEMVDGLVEAIIENGGTFRFNTEVQRLEQENGRIVAVEVTEGHKSERITASRVISAVPIMVLSSLLGGDRVAIRQIDRNEGRQTALLYLFLDQPSGLDHAWINVSCPSLKIGRITNYEAFGGDMVPRGKGCLAVTIFIHPGNELIHETDDSIENLIISELSSSGLLNEALIEDRLLIRIPGAEASNEFQTWEADAIVELRNKFDQFPNLYEVNRAGIDIALFAGLTAAQAILDRSRQRFDREAVPERVPKILPAIP